MAACRTATSILPGPLVASASIRLEVPGYDIGNFAQFISQERETSDVPVILRVGDAALKKDSDRLAHGYSSSPQTCCKFPNAPGGENANALRNFLRKSRRFAQA